MMYGSTSSSSEDMRTSSDSASSWLGSNDHCHGHEFRAAIVKVVSKQLESVLVEQNHCQGLHIVRANYWQEEGQHENPLMLGALPLSVHQTEHMRSG